MTARAVPSIRVVAILLAIVGGGVAFVGGAILQQVDGWAPAGVAVWAAAAIAGSNAVVAAWWARIRIGDDGVLHKRLHPLLAAQQVHLPSLQEAAVDLRPVFQDRRATPADHEPSLRLVDARGGRARIRLRQWAPLPELVRGIRAAAAPAASTPGIAVALADLEGHVPGR